MQVILVAHNIGGACISYAMECFPSKISKAIFVAASMILNGQRAFDVFVRQVLFQFSLIDCGVSRVDTYWYIDEETVKNRR
jgi:hypothetical protein